MGWVPTLGETAVRIFDDGSPWGCAPIIGVAVLIGGGIALSNASCEVKHELTDKEKIENLLRAPNGDVYGSSRLIVNFDEGIHPNVRIVVDRKTGECKFRDDMNNDVNSFEGGKTYTFKTVVEGAGIVSANFYGQTFEDSAVFTNIPVNSGVPVIIPRPEFSLSGDTELDERTQRESVAAIRCVSSVKQLESFLDKMEEGSHEAPNGMDVLPVTNALGGINSTTCVPCFDGTRFQEHAIAAGLEISWSAPNVGG